jgi:hypothetical protein
VICKSVRHPLVIQSRKIPSGTAIDSSRIVTEFAENGTFIY